MRFTTNWLPFAYEMGRLTRNKSAADPSEEEGCDVVINVQPGDLPVLLPQHKEYLKCSSRYITLQITERRPRRFAYRFCKLHQFEQHRPPYQLRHSDGFRIERLIHGLTSQRVVVQPTGSQKLSWKCVNEELKTTLYIKYLPRKSNKRSS